MSLFTKIARDTIGRFAEKEGSEPEVQLDGGLSEPPPAEPFTVGQPVLFRQSDGEVIPSEVVSVTGAQVQLRWRPGTPDSGVGSYPDSGVWFADDRYVDEDPTAEWDRDAQRASAHAAEVAAQSVAAVEQLSSDQIDELGLAYERLNVNLYLGDDPDGFAPADHYRRADAALDDAVGYAESRNSHTAAFDVINEAYSEAFSAMRSSPTQRERNASWLIVNAIEAEVLKDVAFGSEYEGFTPEHYNLLTSDFRRVTDSM